MSIIRLFKRLKFFLFLLAGGVLLILFFVWRYWENQNQANSYTIGIIVNSLEILPGDLDAAKIIIDKKLAEINQTGGIAGKDLRVIYLDDEGNPATLYKLVNQSSRNKNLIAFIGCRSSSRAKVIAPLLGRLKIPFIGGFSLTSVNADYPNIYSSDLSFKEVSVVIKNLLEKKTTKAAFIGQTGDLYSEALLKLMQRLEKKNSNFRISLTRWYPVKYTLQPGELKILADSLNKTSDFLLLSTLQGVTNQILNGLWEHKFKLPVFVGLADMAQIDKNHKGYISGELYDVNILGIPGAMNTRLQQRLEMYKKDLVASKKLEFQVGFGGRFADAIDLVREAYQHNSLPIKAGVREKINQGLTSYINGGEIYRGWFANWYFTPERTFAGEELLAWKPAGFENTVLAPFQFLRINNKLEPAQVAYTNLDLIRLSQINDEKGTFNATFYLEINSLSDLNIEQFDFTNAVRSEFNQEPLLQIKLIRTKKDTTGLPFFHSLYKISGKFNFEPDLKDFPFDEQQFPIRIQTSKARQLILMQPPDATTRDSIFESTGWTYQHNYFGFDQTILSTSNQLKKKPGNISFYNFSFLYHLKRARIDYTLKTLVPLFAILIITYFSVYIPRRQFEALAGVQVTALLSSIALYFATSKPELQYATTSDKIFIFTYIMITSLIGTSIILYLLKFQKTRFTRLLQIYQRIVVPIILFGFAFFIRF
jgi:hypothetical protein